MNNQDFEHILHKHSDYNHLLDSMLNGYAVNEIILDYENKPVDYRFLEVNSSFETLTGLKREDIIGKNILDILPQTQKSWIELCGDVTLNQKDICTEYYAQELQRHYHVRIQSQEKGIFLTILNDITSLKNAYSKLETQKESYESLFNSVRVGLIRTSIDEGKIIKANPACAEMFGFDNLDNLLKSSIVDLYKDPDDRKKYRAKLLRNGKVNHSVLQMQKSNKKKLTIAVSSKLHYEGNLPTWIDSTIQDISRQQRAEERLEVNSIVFKHTLEAVVISDENHKILTVNKAFSDITGYNKKEVLGKDFNLLWCGDKTIENQCDTILNELHDKGAWQGEVRKRHKSGETFPVYLSVIEGEKSKDIKHYISIFYDITYRKQSEDKLFQLAHFDTLTQLSNRHSFMNRLEESVQKAKRYKNKCAVFFMDLDGFKHINDTYGHNAGDEVLIQTANRLKKVIRKSDMLARMGGDEFTLIVENFSDTRSLNILAQKMIKTIAKEIRYHDACMKVTTSIGISIYPDDGFDLESVLKHADNAMYRAKKLGKNNVQFFKKELNIDSVNQMIFEMELRHALEKNEMSILYQPRVCLKDNTIIGFEAVLHWENETYGKVSSDVFLPVAMRSDFINEILSWLLTRSISQVKKWQSKFNTEFNLSLSLPQQYLTQQECQAQIEKALKRNTFNPQLLHIQIRQNILMQEKLTHPLKALQELGAKLIIEDFGSGVSSITDLLKLPICAFKLDKDFIKSKDEQGKKHLQILIQLAHTLTTDIIAEEIDDSDTLVVIKTLGCQLAQGNALYSANSSIDTTLLLSRTFY